MGITYIEGERAAQGAEAAWKANTVSIAVNTRRLQVSST
jgi:hypothetical protein